jgi:hypothetical protein
MSYLNENYIVKNRFCNKNYDWLKNVLYDGCFTYNNEYICSCSSNFCNGDSIESIRGHDDCSQTDICPTGSMCLDTNQGYKCLCPPWSNKCTYR